MKMFCNFFLMCCQVFFSPEEEGVVLYVVGRETGLFWLLNLPLLLLFSILESKNENLHKCDVYKNWLILGGICYNLFLHGCVHVLHYKND